MVKDDLYYYLFPEGIELGQVSLIYAELNLNLLQRLDEILIVAYDGLSFSDYIF